VVSRNQLELKKLLKLESTHLDNGKTKKHLS